MLSTQSLVPFLVLLLALSGNGFLFADAIIGGHLVEKQQLNYMAAVLVNGNQECGGVLVSPIMVLTAAECIMGRKVIELKVTVGTNDLSDGTGQTIDVMEAIIHISAYYPKNDTALLKLTKMIAFNGYVGVIEIAGPDQTYPENTTAITSGFGVVNVYDQKESLLRYANIEIWGDRYCKPYVRFTKKYMICAGNRNGNQAPCKGDLGAPLVVDSVLVGVAVQIYKCSAPYRPIVYISVSKLHAWLDKHVKNRNQRR